MSLEKYHAAIYGKVRGTWNLHHVSLEQNQPLEFFTMLSSISGIVGKKGQSNYSAGNTFLMRSLIIAIRLGSEPTPSILA
jgi:hypothetical protein